MQYLDLVGQFFSGALNDCWAWVTQLNLEEWFILLGVTSGVGFLGMRGFSNKDRC
ncbi:hypothetical protein [Adhaeretor mobilis]|uniref:Uncharacterized protein n=1 Tax=Adhaeretor mobilis TaxID=1930276 RepID=A0A517MXW6_9BACT|nr:hypothetical protein [Adhaeretor mobilis]QDS99713.1 hypothetical protein HG15A2_30420 [Adhaeretor mobilis]